MNIDPALPSSYEYIHYTGENMDTLDLKRAYEQYTEKLAFHTPNGLWLSVTGVHDWEQHCRKNNCRPDALQYEFQVLLKPRANILMLHNNAVFEGLIKEYGQKKENCFDFSIRWNEIISNYQGIALPHVFPQLLNMFSWHKTWCCTSACIWDLQAVDRVEKQ
jgi:hypothetical protein